MLKINAVPSYPPYRANSAATPAKATGAQESSNKTDVVDFSHSLAVAQDKSALSIRSSILREAAQGTEPEKLTSIQSSIKDGTYHRFTEDLVNAILEML